ncbi:MAG: hypothetical protein ACO3QA_07685, partial [Phycisphaerales bacterium]
MQSSFEPICGGGSRAMGDEPPDGVETEICSSCELQTTIAHVAGPGGRLRPEEVERVDFEVDFERR